MRSTVPVQAFVPPPLVQPRYVLPQNMIMQPAPIEYYAEFPTVPTNTGPKNNENLVKPPPTPMKTSHKVLLFLVLGATVLAAGLVPALVLRFAVNTKTTSSNFSCDPACLNGGNCIATNTCLCDTTVWIGSFCQTPVRIFWSFDNTLKDLYNNFNGYGVNNPTFVSPGYNGAGACILLDKTQSQSVTISTPPTLNMAYTSFTLQVWMYAQTLCNNNGCVDNALFGQYDQNILDHILHLNIRNQYMCLGFYYNDAVGTIKLYPQQWYHLSYVYDYATSTQFVYVNGYLDNSRSPAGPYKGTTGNITIGTNSVNSPNNFFDGYLDSMAFFGRAKTAAEILYDATLVTYLPFDGNSLLDSGPLQINGKGAGYSYTSSGRQNGGLSLSGTLSYVQVAGLRRFGTNKWPYSVSIWIKPKSVSGGTLMHLTNRTDGAQSSGWCMPIMSFSASGRIVAQSWSGSRVEIIGPTITVNIWTHVVITYSPMNGESLYVNNVLISTSGGYDFVAGLVPMTLTLGSSLSGTTTCTAGSGQMGQYAGLMDEFYVFARELTALEVSTLYSI